MEDPFEQEYWNLFQVLAWVFLGDRSAVVDAADISADIASLSAHAYFGSEPPVSLGDAKKDLLAKLRSGEIEALGLANNVGDAQAIPKLQWEFLKFYFDPPLAGPHDFFKPGATRWYELRFPTKQALACWPDPMKQALKREVTQPKITQEVRCKEWLLDLMRGQPPIPKSKCKEAAKKKFDVGVKVFNRVWTEAIAESGKADWSKPGARPAGSCVPE